MSRSFITIVLLVVTGIADAQELATAGQLLQQSASRPDAVTSYIAGWRDATMSVLVQTAGLVRGSSGESDETADILDARANCIGRLGVADLALELREMERRGVITAREPSASAALYEIAVRLCQGTVEEALAINR